MAQILIVDDDLYLRELYEEILKGEGYDVETAEDGQEGLDKLKAGQFDLVLLDVMLPKLDGLGVFTNLKEHEAEFKKMPAVIFLTNLGNDPAIKDALSKGAKSYLVKADLNPDQVIAEVKKYL